MRAASAASASCARRVPLVEEVNQAQIHFLNVGVTGAGDVGNRLLPGNHAHALMKSGQKAGIPGRAAAVGNFGREHHVRGQILAHRPKAVADPGADAGPRLHRRAAVDLQDRLRMIRDVVIHGADQADIVHARADVRKELA